MYQSNLDFSIGKSNLEMIHSMQYCQQALYSIVVDNRNIAQALGLWISTFMNDSKNKKCINVATVYTIYTEALHINWRYKYFSITEM